MIKKNVFGEGDNKSSKARKNPNWQKKIPYLIRLDSLADVTFTE